MKQSNTRLFALITILFISTASFGQTTTTAKAEADRGTNSPTKVPSGKPVSVEMIQSDVKEALSVIQGNYVESKTLDYNV